MAPTLTLKRALFTIYRSSVIIKVTTQVGGDVASRF